MSRRSSPHLRTICRVLRSRFTPLEAVPSSGGGAARHMFLALQLGQRRLWDVEAVVISYSTPQALQRPRNPGADPMNSMVSKLPNFDLQSSEQKA